MAWGLLGVSWGPLGISWWPLGALGRVLGPRGALGLGWLLAFSWVGVVWPPLGALFFLALLGRTLAFFEEHRRVLETLPITGPFSQIKVT